MKVAQLLLMGGKNSRMGRPKALLTWRGKTFFERITEEMSACGPVYISVDKKEHVPECAFPIIEDRYEAIGPMGGLASALEVISEEAVFVCACDMPKVTAELIRRLSACLDEDTEVVIVRKEDGRRYMTGAVYAKSLLPRLKEQIRKKDYRMQSLLNSGRVKFLDFEELGIAPDTLDNINTPEDYQNLIQDEII